MGEGSDYDTGGGNFGGGDHILPPPGRSGPGREPPEKSGGITTIGVLNILFGLCCGCFGIAFVVMLVMLPSIMDGMTQAMQQQFAQQSAQLQSRVDAAEESRDEAQAALNASPDDTALQTALDERDLALKDARDRVTRHEKANPTKMFEAMGGMFQDGGMATYNYTNAGAMLLINLLWIISGVGLLGRKNWGRTLALGTAGFKLALEMILGIIAVVVMPEVMADFNASMQEFIANVPGGNAQAQQMQQMGDQMKMQMTMQTIIGALMGCVYPVIVIVVMVQRKTKQEFQDWTDYYLSGGR